VLAGVLPVDVVPVSASVVQPAAAVALTAGGAGGTTIVVSTWSGMAVYVGMGV